MEPRARSVRNPPPKSRLDSEVSTAPLPVAPLDDVQRLACLRLIRSENVGPVTFRELINHFGGATAALEGLPDLVRRSGRSRAIRICPREAAEAELDAARRFGSVPVFTIEPGYPAALAHIQVPPPMLYVKGQSRYLNAPTVAVVGARNGSAAGVKLTRHFASELGKAGFVVASGLARGIDAAAHEVSLDTGTVAVLAGGIDFIYPPENAGIYERIAREGCLITEQPPGFQPRAQDFPRRNRIISGISLGVVVVEAARRSGSLITARTANEQGRLVLAVPGHPLDPRAEGTNDLIKQGAAMVTAAEDVIGAFLPLVPSGQAMGEASVNLPIQADPGSSHTVGSTSPAMIGTDVLALVRSVLGPAPVDVDEVVRATGISVQQIRAALLELSLSGEVEHHGQQLVSLRVLNR